MKSATDAELIALAARLEAANALPDGEQARPEAARLRAAQPMAVDLPAQNSHLRAYIGAGAIILGVLFLLFLEQLSF